MTLFKEYDRIASVSAPSLSPVSGTSSEVVPSQLSAHSHVWDEVVTRLVNQAHQPSRPVSETAVSPVSDALLEADPKDLLGKIFNVVNRHYQSEGKDSEVVTAPAPFEAAVPDLVPVSDPKDLFGKILNVVNRHYQSGDKVSEVEVDSAPSVSPVSGILSEASFSGPFVGTAAPPVTDAVPVVDPKDPLGKILNVLNRHYQPEDNPSDVVASPSEHNLNKGETFYIEDLRPVQLTSGSDTLVYNASSPKRHFVRNFDPENDRIAYDPGEDGQSLTFSEGGPAAFSAWTGELRTGTRLYMDTDGNRAGDLSVWLPRVKGFAQDNFISDAPRSVDYNPLWDESIVFQLGETSRDDSSVSMPEFVPTKLLEVTINRTGTYLSVDVDRDDVSDLAIGLPGIDILSAGNTPSGGVSLNRLWDEGINFQLGGTSQDGSSVSVPEFVTSKLLEVTVNGLGTYLSVDVDRDDKIDFSVGLSGVDFLYGPHHYSDVSPHNSDIPADDTLSSEIHDVGLVGTLINGVDFV